MKDLVRQCPVAFIVPMNENINANVLVFISVLDADCRTQLEFTRQYVKRWQTVNSLILFITDDWFQSAEAKQVNTEEVMERLLALT